jgi:hypothetical protein
MRSRCMQFIDPLFTQRNVITVESIASVDDFPDLRPELVEKKRVVEAMTDKGEQNHA